MRDAIEHPEPPTTPAPERPSRNGLWTEWRAGVQLVRLGLASLGLRRLPRGDGSGVILIPGWRAPEASMEPLRRYLRWLGYDARHWGFGINRGDPEGDRERMAPVVTELAWETSRPVALIGWSLGGVIARETARLLPDDVSRVVTYGTPAVGGPSYTLGASVWGREECQRITELTRELDQEDPIRVPITAIFSRNDAIVSWPACIDRTSPNVRHFEVRSTHVGMGLDPAVWTVIAAHALPDRPEDRP